MILRTGRLSSKQSLTLSKSPVITFCTTTFRLSEMQRSAYTLRPCLQYRSTNNKPQYLPYPYSIKRLVFITEKEWVHCAVRTGSLNIQINFVLQWVAVTTSKAVGKCC